MADTITADIVASSTSPCNLPFEVELADYLVAEEGYCVAVRALADKEVYNVVEGCDEVFHTIKKGHILLGALGERQALKGYSGRIPRRIQVGDTLHVLNMGGIIGLCTSDHPNLGPALPVEVLGAVIDQADGVRTHARIQDYALDPVYALPESAPLVMVAGTSMDTGKTYACAKIVQGLTERGFQVGAAKLTGASLMRDVRSMKENGAIAVATFTDAGIVASTNKVMPPFAKAMIASLNAYEPDVIVLELGDGFIGYYGVDDLLQDKELARHTKAHVVAATDLAGVWAADQLYRARYRSDITVMVGPVTDNLVGKQYIQNALGIAAHNAITEPEAIVDEVVQALHTSPSAAAPMRGIV
ncbi:MAG: hypothetical protein RhofKO_36680 [Rhodothermales bacterium]